MSTPNRPLPVNGLALGGLALLIAVSAMVCASPDPEGRFDDFEAATEDRRQIEDTGPMMGVRQDFSGNYFIALSTPLGPDKPLHIRAEVSVADDLSTINFSFFPLRTDTLIDGSARGDARTDLGDALIAMAVPFNEDGTFIVDLGEVSVLGEANPLTGSDITTTLVLNGVANSTTSWCGTASGTVTVPINADLAGSKFAAVAVGDDIAAVTPEVACPDNPNNDMPDGGMDVSPDAPDADDNPFPEGRCVDTILAGEYDVQFITATQEGQGAPATELTLVLTADPDPAVCYTGELTANTDGSVLGSVDYVLEVEGKMIVHVNEFIIPPGANPLLPDGGKATIELTSAAWQPDGFCGPMVFSLFEPFPLDSDGRMAIVRKNTAGLQVDGPGCEGVTRTEPCGFEAMAGRYDLRFKTASGGSNFFINIEENALTCLSGTFESKLEPGSLIGDLIFAEPAEAADQIQLNFRNFVIAPGANPLLPDGGTADVTMISEQIGEGTMCGEITVSLFEPFATDSGGTFNAGTVDGNEPDTDECP